MNQKTLQTNVTTLQTNVTKIKDELAKKESAYSAEAAKEKKAKAQEEKEKEAKEKAAKKTQKKNGEKDDFTGLDAMANDDNGFVTNSKTMPDRNIHKPNKYTVDPTNHTTATVEIQPVNTQTQAQVTPNQAGPKGGAKQL